MVAEDERVERSRCHSLAFPQAPPTALPARRRLLTSIYPVSDYFDRDVRCPRLDLRWGVLRLVETFGAAGKASAAFPLG
jgi:hypothetical protein